MPWIYVFGIITMIINSTQRIDKYGDNGLPFRTPLVILKKDVE